MRSRRRLLCMQPKREPRPKKPRVERPASEPIYVEDDEEDFDLAMEDDAADEDFDFAMEVIARSVCFGLAVCGSLSAD